MTIDVSGHEEGLVMDFQIECVARALFSAEDNGQSWESAPETLREEFRDLARTALRLLSHHRTHEADENETAPFPYAA